MESTVHEILNDFTRFGNLEDTYKLCVARSASGVGSEGTFNPAPSLTAMLAPLSPSAVKLLQFKESPSKTTLEPFLTKKLVMSSDNLFWKP